MDNTPYADAPTSHTPGFDDFVDKLIAEVEADPKLLNAVESTLLRLTAAEKVTLTNAMSKGGTWEAGSNVAYGDYFQRLDGNAYGRSFSIRLLRKPLLHLTQRTAATSTAHLTKLGQLLGSYLV